MPSQMIGIAVPVAQNCLLDATEEGYVSEVDYWEHYYENSDYEWNAGRLEKKPVFDYLTSLTYYWFVELLQRFLAVHPVAGLTGLDFGSRLVLPYKVTIRKPDLGLIRHDNPNPIKPLDRTYKGVYGLCIEAFSDSNKANRDRDQVTKKAKYVAAGIPEYFILHHQPRHQAFYTLTERGVYAPIHSQDGVIYSLVLPGFCLRLADLNQRPNIDELRTDPIYQAFIAPGWRAAENQAQTEALLRKQEEQAKRKTEQALQISEQRANTETTARQAAEQRAQRLAEQLRTLGIDPDAI